MTEKDALTKWCPIAGLAGAVFFASPDRTMTAADDTNRNCIGSGCMMWRWSTAANGPDDEGYCGLASQSQTAIPPAAANDVRTDSPVSDSPSQFTASELDARRIAGGVYSNPQPGDADYPGG